MVEQIELFPQASDDDKKIVKEYLKDYQKYKKTIKQLTSKVNLSTRELEVLRRSEAIVNDIETSINIILDDEVKHIIMYRFLHANPRKAAVVRWNNFTDRTFDRKVDEGIDSIASTLKTLGKI